jgi:hypothetical protein
VRKAHPKIIAKGPLPPIDFALPPSKKAPIDHFRRFRRKKRELRTSEWQSGNGGDDVGLLTHPLPASFFYFYGIEIRDRPSEL